MLLNYDPFGANQMVYTIKQKCEEYPSLDCDNGVTIIYFNAKGNKGGSAEPKKFLTYLDDSRNINVTNEVTKTLNEYVYEIKNQATLREKYMTLGEYFDNEIRLGIEEGLQEAVQEKDNELQEKNAQIEMLKNVYKKLALMLIISKKSFL